MSLVEYGSCQRKVSPCPSVFTHSLESDTSDTWYGTIKLQTSVPLHSITVDVIFDRQTATFGAYYFNDVTTTDYIEYRIENKNLKLNPGRTLLMNVYIRFTDKVPLIKQIRLNGQNICVNLPTIGVQSIHNFNSNSQTSTSTKRSTRRENPNYKWENFRHASIENDSFYCNLSVLIHLIMTQRPIETHSQKQQLNRGATTGTTKDEKVEMKTYHNLMVE